jgi:DNA-binding transcriptional LysR family regulator
MDRLRALEVFVAVVSQESFTRAANALDTSPANVTRYVNELEAHLGTRLLNRSPRKLSLTESGAAFYERGKSILNEVAEAEAIASNSLKPRGRLRVNASVSFGVRFLAPLWPKFMDKYPEIDLDVVLNDETVDLVKGGYDMAVRISRAGSEDYVARKLMTSQDVVCASPAYVRRNGQPKAPVDLGKHLCIGYIYAPTAEEWRFTDEAGNSHIVKVKIGMQTNSCDTGRAAALAGAGIIWQPLFMVSDDLKAGRLLALLPDYHLPTVNVSAVYPSRRHLSGKVRAMVDFLVNEFRDTKPWGQPAIRPSLGKIDSSAALANSPQAPALHKNDAAIRNCA